MKDIKEIINFEKYPINKTNSSEYKDLVQYNRDLLDNDGCCVLPNFIKEDSIKKMKEEAERNLEKVHWTKDSHNPYFYKR